VRIIEKTFSAANERTLASAMITLELTGQLEFFVS
jgi:hypothetical protein